MQVHNVFFFLFLSVLEGTKTSCRKRNLTYFLGQNCLPSIWYQKIPIFVCFFPPKIQQTSCTESTAGISRSLLHGQSQPPLEQGSAGRGQPEPKVQRTFCLFILPFQPGKDKLMSSAFSSLWLSFYTAERKRSYAQIFPPKQLSEYNKDKKQSDPPPILLFCHSTGQGVLPQQLFPIIREEAQAKISKGISGWFPGAPEQDFILAQQIPFIEHLLCQS